MRGLTARCIALAAVVLGAVPAVAAEPFETTSDVVYRETDGQQLKADVFVPNGPGPFPAVLVVHGGAWTLGNKSHMTKIGSALARHGYTSVVINYRLAPKYTFPAQILDCKAAGRWMREARRAVQDRY